MKTQKITSQEETHPPHGAEATSQPFKKGQFKMSSSKSFWMILIFKGPAFGSQLYYGWVEKRPLLKSSQEYLKYFGHHKICVTSCSLMYRGQNVWRLSYLSADTLNVFQIKFRDKNDDQTVGHLIVRHVVEHRLKSWFQIALRKKYKVSFMDMSSIGRGW